MTLYVAIASSDCLIIRYHSVVKCIKFLTPSIQSGAEDTVAVLRIISSSLRYSYQVICRKILDYTIIIYMCIIVYTVATSIAN